MPTITRSALQYIEDQIEERDAQIDELEDELALALEENASLRAQINRLASIRGES